MQAIKCSLSDIANVPKEATGWFKEAVLEKQLKAIVVAKESDGKLLIELFDGNTQLNAKLKEGLRLRNKAGLSRQVENETLCSQDTDVKKRNEPAESSLNTGRPREKKKCRSEAQGGEESSKTHVKPGGGNLPQPSVKRGLPGELLEAAEKLSSSEGALLARVGEEKQTVLSVKVGAQSDNKSGTKVRSIPVKNVSDLPQRSITPAHEVLTYVSHVNDPSDFYVQLASDEGQLSTISECLNSETPAKDPCGQLLQAGDLISAVYSEDSLWYRAVVKGKASGDSVSVQYIDYGNAAVISIDQAHKLPEDLASVPAMAVHCSLSGLQCSKSTGWSEKAIEYFTKRTSEVLLTCEFVEKAGDKWAVMLSDDQGVITVDLSGDAVNTCQPLPSQALNEISSVSDNESFPWKFPEAGQTVQIYVMVVKGPEYFWSCSADTESINYIEEKIKEAENRGLNSLNSCIKSGDTCLAKYSQDGKLYRARVTSVTDDGVAVRHVDYGSEETVGLEMLRQMPCELLKVPNQAFACCLSGFDSSEGSWLSEAKEKFYDMTVEVLLEAEVVETQDDKAFEVPLCVVKLEASGKSINEEMKAFWKANTGSDHKAVPDLESPVQRSSCSSSDTGLCLKRETTAGCGLAQEGSESALLRSECFLDVTSGCSNAGGEDGEEDSLGLEHAALQSSANNGSQFSFFTKDLTSQRPVCTIKSCDCRVEKHKEWQKKKDERYVEEWMKEDLAESFRDHRSAPTHVQSSGCEPMDAGTGRTQNDNLADCSAGKVSDFKELTNKNVHLNTKC
uniref:Tudor domain-containing protein n=1 Tax=Anas platyrhynchos TaxID=8839 RepID=A0A8B9QYT7_ANAPL